MFASYEDLRDFEAIFTLMFNDNVRIGECTDFGFFQERVKGAVEALKPFEGSTWLCAQLEREFRWLASTLAGQLESAEDDYLQQTSKELGKCCEELKADADKFRDIECAWVKKDETRYDSIKELLTGTLKVFCGGREAEKNLDSDKGYHYWALRCEELSNILQSLKRTLAQLEKHDKSLILRNWNVNRVPFNESRYFVINAATTVSDAFKGIQTISASVVDLECPYWYLQDRRHVLFVYEVTDDNVLGMFTADSSAYFSNNKDVESLITQLLTADGLEGKEYLGCNYVGFRPAYPMLDMVNHDNRISEILLKGDSRPIGIILADDYGNELYNALAYRKLFPETTVWTLNKGTLVKVP